MGDVASGCVCDTFRNMLLGTTEMSGFLPVALRCAQANLMREQIRLNATTKMKTTAVALAVDDKKAYVAQDVYKRQGLYQPHRSEIQKNR